jgi:hypothetical protein
MGLAGNRCGYTIDPAGNGPLGIEVTQVMIIEKWTSDAFLGQVEQHIFRRLPLVDVHPFEPLFDLIVFSIGLFCPPEDGTPFLPSERFVEMIVHIDRLDKGDIKHGVTAIAAVHLTPYTVCMSVLDCCEYLVCLSNQGLIFLKGP